jgi:hypothetical protein
MEEFYLGAIGTRNLTRLGKRNLRRMLRVFHGNQDSTKRAHRVLLLTGTRITAAAPPRIRITAYAPG